MKFAIYDYIDEKKENKPLFETDKTFNLVSEQNKIINKLIRAINNYSYTLIIDDVTYQLEDMFVAEIEIRKVAKLYFLFANNENEEKILEASKTLKEMPVTSDEEKQNKISATLEIMKQFNPLLFICNQYEPSFVPSAFNENTITLSKSNPEEPEEKVIIRKKNFLIDVIFLVFMPALMVTFLYITIHFFVSDKAGLGVALIFITLLEVAVFCYSLVLINDEEENRALYNKHKLLLYLINLGGLVFGLGITYPIGYFLLSTGGAGYVFGIDAICLGITFIICIGLNIGMYYLSAYLRKRKEEKKKTENKQ